MSTSRGSGSLKIILTQCILSVEAAMAGHSRIIKISEKSDSGLMHVTIKC